MPSGLVSRPNNIDFTKQAFIIIRDSKRIKRKVPFSLKVYRRCVDEHMSRILLKGL